MQLIIRDLIYRSPLESASIYVGPYFSYPISIRWQIGGKLLTGYEFYKGVETHLHDLPSRNGIAFGTGVSMNYLAMQNLGVRFMADYDLAPSISRSSNQPLHKLSFGIQVCAAF